MILILAFSSTHITFHKPPLKTDLSASFWCSDEETKHNQLYQGKLHLQTNYKAESCLGASSKQKLTSKDHSQGALSPCKLEANQVLQRIFDLSRY